ncbi:MAG TPA: alpha/beta fold hydrolase, partial [Nannocystaceae bacterium]|nr:alpha/beta fold hydrolase [Nannocystaceae bacterium]
MRRELGGHLWTIAPELRDRVRPLHAPASEPWSVVVEDARVGAVRLGGRVRHEPDAQTLLLVVHGLGGSSESPYVRRAAVAAGVLGWSCLRIDLRGADGRGEDVYHAGLWEDLVAGLAERSLARYSRVAVLGFSLGGHVTMRLALAGADPRVTAVAAVCAPLDLGASATAFDRRRVWLYRSHVLRALKATVRAVASRRGSDLGWDLPAIMGVRKIREWDARVVVPRHGFADVDDYYARASAAPRLGELAIPALYIGARHDPMVPAFAIEPA